MPQWSSGAAVQTLLAGVPQVVWNAETVPATGGAAQISVAVGLQRHPHLANVLSVELDFAADPGSFAVDLQLADTNVDANYVTKATINSGLNAGFVGRVEITNVVAKFARLKMATKTNAVAVTAKFF